MSMKDKRVKSVVESDDENEQGACGVSNDSRRFSLAVPEPTPGSLLEESVDNLSMEVHLGGDSSRHPSEISSVSYQNLLDDGEPSNSIISRRGSDDSLDSYPPDFPDAELPPDDLETFEASDLPLSEHFPMGAIQGADSREKSRGDRSSYVSDNSSNLSHHNVRLKDQPPSDMSENVKLREKSKNEPNLDTEEASAKRSSLEIRNNIPVIGEVKDYEKELNIDFNRVPGHKSTVTGLKQSPGVARRIDIETHTDRDSSGTDDIGKQSDSRLPSASSHPHPSKLRSKKTSSKSKENGIEVITPIPRNINVENEYDYVKYARVQQGNSYVGMRLAYSSSSDSLNIKQGVFSEDNSREPSPEKNIQQKILPDNGSQDKVCEETLMEIPLNTNDYTEDKKAFTLSPENTECDSVEVESVTSEGGNSTPGFPTLEDGLSSSQASDADEGGSGIGNDHSPSRLIKAKQKAAIEQDISKNEEDCRPKEIDAQAIMNDLKMKREALDMAIADIKSAIQRSKSMSLETSYPSQTEPEGIQPVWVKRVNKEAANLAQRRQEEMRRVQEEIERQHEEIAPSQGKSNQDLCEREKFIETCEGDEDDFTVTGRCPTSADTECQKVKSDTSTCTDAACETYDNVFFQTEAVKNLPEAANEQVSSYTDTSLPSTLGEGSTNQLPVMTNMVSHETIDDDQLQLTNKLENDSGEHNLYNIQHCRLQQDSCSTQQPVSNALSVSSLDRKINVNCDKQLTTENTAFQSPRNCERHGNWENNIVQTVVTVEHLRFEDEMSKNVIMRSDIYKDYPKDEMKGAFLDSALQTAPNNQILCFGSWGLESTKIDNSQSFDENSSGNKQMASFACQVTTNHQLSDHCVQDGEGMEAGMCFKNENRQPYTEDTISDSVANINDESIAPKLSLEYKNCGDGETSRYRHQTAEGVIVRKETGANWTTKEAGDGVVDSVVLAGHPRGYDSDDECEDAEGIRYTRRIKGIKYAPLQIDDSLEMSGTLVADTGRDVAKPNGHMLSNKHGSHMGSNGSLVGHKQAQTQSGEHHIHSSETPLSSEENSDIEANITSYTRPPNADSDTDEETDRLLQKQYQERDKHVEIPELSDPAAAGRRSEAEIRHSKAKEAAIRDPDRPEVLIEGVLFRARYLGSTQLISEGQPSKAMRMMQAQEAVGRIKAPEGENQPSTDVDLFVSTEKIMVLNTDLQEIMMDHSLRTISYIADIGDILVIMARRRLITSPDDMLGRRRRQAKILCHVFESDEAQLIAQSIGQAFQVAYLEFLKANGIEDPGLLKEMDYQDVLNQQEIYGEELNLFANKDFHKEVIVPKSKNEPLGVVIVESGWGSMVPTVVLANMLPTGPAARCGQLNIGDQIISINGISLVGLPLSACQTYIKASRSQTVVKLTVVPCPPVVEVLIKRPDVKYQLGFSVQNGVICSLLRGGIAERGGVRVGHRIIEINNQSVVAVPHEKIVTLLASSVGEIHMKTMPTSIFRLLTGQDVPHYL